MILDEIIAAKRQRLKQHKRETDEETMRRTAYKLADEGERNGHLFYQALAKPGLSIIGEFKKASPSMGVIDHKIELLDRIDQYNDAMDAISCLTEEDFFHGSAEIFQKVRSMSELPMIRKDFIIEPYQVYEAKVIGADAVLLIAAILDDETMRELYELAESLALDVLLEVHDEHEMQRALNLGARILGVNNRDLKDFTIRLETTKRLTDMVPRDRILVSESGVTGESDILYLKDCRVDALLIGRAFMESERPKELGRRWKELFADT
ncbi:indole-3-glycerol phosphate synthase TrpC [Ruminococcus gauvreauii]|uniref:Indole-3-glycerol phosphate synthase n=1 Tax=Ruminococcus gauvreauii TaxID=438033 RepID=A0ABY5VH89_9FIRM|nr:indole-3-glycerol phosphate synthase TrpC [Ruminococcus gauvreauii]UWP58878.1 indole-3-glycerol phosphate synthase TrpC [Ruminococcus gauvreauii]